MAVGRRRKNNKHLPQRVYLEHGRYWFRPVTGARVDLGTTMPEMYAALAKQSRVEKPLGTMSAVFDKFLQESLPALADRTQSDYRKYIERLRPVFTPFAPREVTAGDLFDVRRTIADVSGPVQANRHVSCLSAVFREAVGWKAVERNPCKELKRLHEPRRDRYVDDAEFSAVYTLASPVLQCLMDLATITGQREGDLLRLPNRDPKTYTEAGVVFRPGKSKRRHPRHGRIVETSKTVIVEWSDELRAVVDRARALCGRDIRPTLICNLDAEGYTESGFRSNWHRLMKKATATKDAKGNKIEPKLAEPFTFHDLRAKSATDDEIEEAHERLGHDDMRTTQTIYRRKPRRARAGRKVTA